MSSLGQPAAGGQSAEFRSARIVFIGVLVLFYLPFLYLYGYEYVSVDNVDFTGFYAAPKLAFERDTSPYTKKAFADPVSLIGEEPPPTLTGRLIPSYLYPPPSLLLFYPLTFFSFRGAKLLFLIISHLLVLPVVYLIAFRILGAEANKLVRQVVTTLCVLYALISYPVIANFEYGQVNIIVLMFLALSWSAWKSGKPPLFTALPLAFAVVLKTYPIVLVALLLIRRKYRELAWLFGLLAGFAVLAFLLLPASVWPDWFRNVLPTGGYGKNTFNLFSPAQSRNHSINGFFTRIFTKNIFAEPIWLHAGTGRRLSYFAALAVIGTTAAVSYLTFRRDQPKRDFDVQFSLFLVMMVLVAPLSWESHLVFALPAAFLAVYLLASQENNYRWIIAVFLSLGVIAWRLPVDSPALRKGLWTLVIPVKFYALVFLWCYLVRQAWRERSRETISLLQTSTPLKWLLTHPLTAAFSRRRASLTAAVSSSFADGEAKFVALFFVISRLVVFAVASLSRSLMAPGPLWQAGGLLGALTQGDSAFYLEQARDTDWLSSQATRQVGLFPVFPLLVRTVAVLIRDPGWAGVLVANFSLFAAALLLYRLVKLDGGDARTSRAAVTFLLFSPVSFLFSSALPEATALLLAIASLLAARKGRWGIACIAAIGLSATMSIGSWVILPLVIEYVRQNRAVGTRLGGLLRWQTALLALVPAYLVALLIMGHAKFANAAALLPKPADWELSFERLMNISSTFSGYEPFYHSLFWLVVLASAAVWCAGLRLKLRASYVAYSAALILTVICTRDLEAPRTLGLVFPLCVALALLARRFEGTFELTLTCSTTLLVLCTVAAANGFWLT